MNALSPTRTFLRTLVVAAQHPLHDFVEQVHAPSIRVDRGVWVFSRSIDPDRLLSQL
ncbi:hypothetical protein M407DRAFT_240436 [Tulasnella calospora MUT 4182]|uniref:Uncharacterized protein n=1 Tax=Tulasnella calospora MUT 4182 TaxID=1051891 RepID=A0A0C3QN34_9AGAM|nr:hypothetical protein M407DRAFT_240436 [Tulasnella calospora MUT 4182]